MNSENEYVERMKETLGTVLKIAGGAFVANTAFKLFTGKSAIDSLSQSVASKASAPEAWQKVYKTNAERVGVLRDSITYLGNYDFVYLAQKYRDAKLHNKTTIDLPALNKSEMSPDQVYTALDVFFSKYGRTVDERGHAVDVEKTYKNWDPPATWLQAVSNEMVSHDDIDIGSSVIGDAASRVAALAERGYYAAGRTLESGWEGTKKYADKAWTGTKKYAGMAYDAVDTDTITDYTKRGGRALGRGVGVLTGGVVAGTGYGLWNVLEGGAEGVGLLDKDQSLHQWSKDFYKRNFGEPGDDPEITKFLTQTIEKSTITAKDFPNYIKQKSFISEPTAQGFIEAFNAKVPEQSNEHIKKFGDTKKDGSIYIIASRPSVVSEGEAGKQKGIDEADKIGREYLKNYLKTGFQIDVGDQIDKYVQLHKVVYVDGVAMALIRMPKPRGPEWTERQFGTWGKGVDKKEEIFGPNDKIDYDGWGKNNEPWKQEQFRLRFYVDADQGPEIKSICDFLAKEYQGMNRQAAMKRVFEGPAEDVIKAKNFVNIGGKKGFEQKLMTNALLLNGLEEKINGIEKDVSEEVGKEKGAAFKREKLEEIKKGLGYKVRLAILGDTEALKFYKSNPDVDMDIQKESGKFIEWYKKMLEKKFSKTK